MFEGLADQFTAENVDEHTVILGEFIKSLIVELVGDESGEKTPKQAMELARAFQATVAAQKISTERRQKIEADFAAKAGKAIDQVAQVKGLTADTVEEIYSKVLGVER
jgi:hypothetical protein